MPPFKITSASVSVCHASNFFANMVQIQFIAVHFSSILFIVHKYVEASRRALMLLTSYFSLKFNLCLVF